MSILFSFIEILATFVEGLVLFFAGYNLFVGKMPDKIYVLKFILAELAYTIIITFCNRYSMVSIVTFLLGMFIFSVLLVIICKEKFINCFIFSVSYGVLLIILEMLFICIISVLFHDTDYVFKIINNSNESRCAYIVFMKLLNLGIYLFLRKTLIKSDYSLITHPAYIVSVAIGLLVGMNLMGIINKNNIVELKIGVIILFIAFITIIVLVIFLENKLLKRQVEIDERHYIDLKNQMLESELNNTNKLYVQSSKNFHEFNNFVNTLSLMLKDKQYDKMENYLSKISLDDEYKSEFFTGNKIVDMVINSKYVLMKKKNINFVADFDDLNNLHIGDMEICSILTNLLDNAIEANENLDKKEIRLTIKRKGNAVVITVVNNCSNTVNIYNLVSNKIGNHGWGLKIIEDIVNKYNGYIDKKIEDNQFYVFIMLFEAR